MPHQIMRRIRLAHCKLGPERCEECREMEAERWCVLEVFPPDEGLMQRRLIQVEVDGEVVWRAFDVLRVFQDEQEALAYSRERGITDIEF